MVCEPPALIDVRYRWQYTCCFRQNWETCLVDVRAGLDRLTIQFANDSSTSYGHQKRFQRLASITVGSPANWIADISWSDWTVKGDTCGQKLQTGKNDT